MRTGVISTPNYGSVLSLSDMKDHMIVEHADDDAFIGQTIISVISNCENIGRISIPTTDRFVEYGTTRKGRLFIPYGKVVSVNSVILVSFDGNDDVVLEAGVGYSHSVGNQIIILHESVAISFSHPTIRIEYTAGFTPDELAGANSNIILAIKQFVTHLYEHRGEDKRTAVNMPKETRRVLGEYWTSPTYYT